MSAYVVDPETINRVLGAIRWDREVSFPCAPGFQIRPREMSDEQFNALGRALMAMNVEAVNQRYNDAEMIPQGYQFQRFSPSPVSRVQGIKSMQCLRYQCSEGDVPKSLLYQWLGACIYNLMSRVVDALPEYSKAQWA